jgi:hypothetical protein
MDRFARNHEDRVRQAGMMGKSLRIFRNRVRNQKYSAFVLTQISRTTSPVSRQMRGASRSSRTRGEMRWTLRARETYAPLCRHLCRDLLSD